MTKNMTRKGLAIGAAAALVAAGFGSMPANAASTLTFAPSAGSGYSTLANSTFTLNVGVPSSVSEAAYKFLRYRVLNPSLSALTLDMLVAGNNAGSVQANNYSGADTSYATGGSESSAGGVTDNDFVVQPAATSGAPAGAIGSTLGLTISPDAFAGTSVEVTAWLDTNNNNTIDVGEEFSPTRTVTFVKSSTATASVALVAPIASDATMKANVTFTGDINVQQIDAADVLVQFGTYSGTTFTVINSFVDAAGTAHGTTTVTTTGTAAGNNVGNDVVWNSTDSVYEAVFTPYDTVAAAGASPLLVSAAITYAARLFLDNDDDGTTAVTDTREGAVSTSLTTADATAYSAKVHVVGSVDAKTSTIGYEDNGSDNYLVGGSAISDNIAAVAEVRATTTASSAFDLKVFVGTDAAAPAPLKSVPVTVIVTANGGTSLADAVVVEGKTVYNGVTRSFTKSTGADGFITISVAAGKADATDALDFAITMNGINFGGSNASDATVTFGAADYSIFATDDMANTGAISITSGSSYAINYRVIDQWGKAPADSAYRVVATDVASSNSERTTAADFAYNVPVVGGKATVTVNDNGVGTGSYTMRAAHAALDGAAGSSGADAVDTTVRVVADGASSTITLSTLVYGSVQATDNNGDGDYTDTGEINNTSKLILETETLSAYVANTATPSQSAPDLTANQFVTVGGTVKNAAGTAVPFAPVTLQAAGFLFKSGSNYLLDTVTLRTNALGVFSVDVYSAVGGIQTIRMTSGSATANQSLTYAAAVSGAAASFTLTSPGASEPGKTVDVSVMVTDKFGNAVQGATVTLASTGPGYLLNTTGTTLRSGVFSTKLLVGSNDSGSAIITATMTIDNVETSRSTAIVIGVGAVAAADPSALPAGAVVNVGTFNGKIVVYAKGLKGSKITWKIAGKWEKADVTLDYQRFDRPTVALGLDVMVDIHMAGVKTPVFSTTVTTK